MANKFGINSKIMESVAINGTAVDIRTAAQLYLNSEFMKITAADESPFPKTGIVRKKVKVEKGNGDSSYVNFGLPVDLADKGGFVLLFLEISGISAEYSSFINDEISEIDFISLLLPVYIETQESVRIPSNGEIVFVDYRDDTDPFSIFFAGLPTTSAVLDPNTASYKKNNNNGARNRFASGTGI